MQNEIFRFTSKMQYLFSPIDDRKLSFGTKFSSNIERLKNGPTFYRKNVSYRDRCLAISYLVKIQFQARHFTFPTVLAMKYLNISSETIVRYQIHSQN